MNAHIIVIGGGIAGLASAWELARRGARVEVLERGEPGRESSWAGAGILSLLLPW
ncbi:MAG: FAD-dependent oxidoreductase, partial [Gallionellaceae bacterium]|nr:FAD-dependent oxidoreductase [Gallionellaceae bacterium]